MEKNSTPVAEALPGVKSYQRVTDQGEVVSKYKYMAGMPRGYRFDGKAGVFNIDGGDPIGKKLTFQPIAWQLFTDDLFNMGPKSWAELFFIDDKKAVSSILFHGYSVENLKRLIQPLFYDDLTLADVVLTATAEKKTRQSDNGTYFLAEFSYIEAPKERIAEYAEYVKDVNIWRGDTLKTTRNVSITHGYPMIHASEHTTEQLAAPAESPAEPATE